MQTYYYATDDDLVHHGIKGQKWGHRRYQNEDGSLTMEGYQHWGLNPDGSKFKEHNTVYTQRTAGMVKKGALIGTVAGVGLGLATGGASAAASLALIGQAAGISIGGIGGTITTRRGQKKIREALKKNGKVYVSDLK